jgi:hypothetical protein
MSLPKNVNFSGGAQIKASAVAAVSSQFNCKPVTGTSWSAGNTITFDLGGCGTRSTWLNTQESYLIVDVTVTSAAALSAYLHPWDLIKTLNLYASSGSFQLESVQEYAVLHGMLRDLCSDRNNHLTSDTIMLNADPLRSRICKPIVLGSATLPL